MHKPPSKDNIKKRDAQNELEGHIYEQEHEVLGLSNVLEIACDEVVQFSDEILTDA
jgi:hypothetical protein